MTMIFFVIYLSYEHQEGMSCLVRDDCDHGKDGVFYSILSWCSVSLGLVYINAIKHNIAQVNNRGNKISCNTVTWGKSMEQLF